VVFADAIQRELWYDGCVITVIIAGGSGTRLWPLSTPDYPKHLLSLTGSKALIRYVYERSKSMSKSIYVITEIGHAHHVREQLPELDDANFIVEPGRRGTASCIVAALDRISKLHDSDEPIAFMPADHYVRDTAGFKYSFKIAEKVSKKSDRVVLIGVEPDHPATGFGYIQKGDSYNEEQFVFDVKAFKEKPDYKAAQQYINSGEYLWNCGYFVGSTNTFMSAMKHYAPDLYDNYQKLQATKDQESYKKNYLAFENISIDYALIEKVPDLLVVTAAFDWMDLGSYGDLHKAVGSDEQGNHIYGDKVEIAGVENSIIRNHEDKPVAVIGLDNVAVINTPQGLLVTRKDLAQTVGDVSKRFNSK